MKTQNIKKGDIVTFHTCCNADRKLLKGIVTQKSPDHMELITLSDGSQYELQKAIDLTLYKSAECSKVLQLMDEDFSYQKALNTVLAGNNTIIQSELETELNIFI